MLIKYAVKRAMDISGAFLGLLVLSPVMLLVAVMVWATMGRPVIFRQIRPGFKKKPFEIMKFRSMKNAVDNQGNPLSDAARLTWFGKQMRNLSLDEIPQLFNILKGEMSIVGPRPLLYDFFPYYTEEEMRRHDVKPGVTGLAQINGRNNISWDDKLRFDVEYVDHWSIWMDIKIILKTIVIVVKRTGVQTDGYATFLRLDDDRQARM